MLIWARAVRPGAPDPTRGSELLRFGDLTGIGPHYARNNLDIILVGALLGPHMSGCM